MRRPPQCFLAGIGLWIWCGAGIVHGAEQETLVSHWGFDGQADTSVGEQVTGRQDLLAGRNERVAGVVQSALAFDGFTTRVSCPARRAPELSRGFTIESWIALRAYPWGWCPIVSQRSDHRAGYLFGVDATGRVSVQAAVDAKWVACTSEAHLPLLAWQHVCGCFDPTTGLRVYINGKLEAQTQAAGKLEPAADVDLLLGRNHVAEPCMFETIELPVFFSLDGLLDEVKIHDRALSQDEVRRSYLAVQPPSPPPLRHCRLPSGPLCEGRFGAFYEHLAYHPNWDAQWRSSNPDVVVVFDKADYRLVCWRGTSYAPCWVTEKGNWFTNEFMERGVDRATRGCTESMSDKRAEFSQAKILENNAARAVVYWRHSPVDIYYQKPFVDQETGWGDWAEEYHTIYPDGMAVRKVVMYSNDFQQWHEWCQSIEPLHPGQRPEDVLDRQRVVSLANMQGKSQEFGWPQGEKSYKFPTFPGANVQITFLNSTFNPFLILDDRPGKNDAGGEGPAITLVGGAGWSEYSYFPWRNHWPVTQIPIIGRYAVAADRPAHTYTATQHSAAYETSDYSMTKVMLCGMTDCQDAAGLLPLARSWLRAPRARCLSDGWVVNGYDLTERAYVVRRSDDAEPGSLALVFEATESSPLVNPAIIVERWGERGARLNINGRPISPGPGFRCGHRQHLSHTDLIVWLELEQSDVCRLSLRESSGPDKSPFAPRK